MNEQIQTRALPAAFKAFVYSCFFLSGAAGLIYEVVWSRQLGLFLGVTSFAHTAVITAYMGGLAAGSFYFGRRSDKSSRPLEIYAWLEICVGLYAASTPWLFKVLQATYADIAGTAGVAGVPGHAARLLIAFVALIIPTFLMGGTLPLLVRGVVQTRPQLGRVTSHLYGINTLGAMTGTLLAGYVLLPGIGVSNSIYVGVVINLLIAIVVLLLTRIPSWREQPPVPADSHGNEERADDRKQDSKQLGNRTRVVVLAGFGAAGFAALLTQLAWIRAMVMLVGGSVYAFTISLACFLAGIGLGSLAYNRFFSRKNNNSQAKLYQAGTVAVLTGFSILLGLLILAKLPEWYLNGFASGVFSEFGLFQLYIFMLAALVMVFPTFCMGILFPLMTVIWTREHVATGQGVGTAYAINTAGTILGALIGGLFLLPWLGVQHSIILAGTFYVLVAVAFWLRGSSRSTGLRKAATPVLSLIIFALIAVNISPWDRAVWGNGVFHRSANAVELLKDHSLHELMSMSDILYYKEGLDGTVAVFRDETQKYLVINGKTDATSVGDLETQILIGQLPALIHPNPTNALVIGLGSGVTANAVASHESITDIKVLEISQEVVEASSFFIEENANVLQSPKVDLITADARNYVQATDETWDLVISEPSNPWISGVSNLFTVDFFEDVKQHLTRGGVMLQWFHTYSMSEADFKTVLHSFNSTFNHVSVWHVQQGDVLLLASDTPYAFDLPRLKQQLADERIARDLARVHIYHPRDILRKYLIGGENLDNYLRRSTLNTDDRPRIEFSAPRNLYAETTRSNLLSVVRFLESQRQDLPILSLVHLGQYGLSLDLMDLLMNFDGLDQLAGVNVSWRVWRDLVDANGEENFGVGTMRLVEWQRQEAAELVSAIWQAQPQSEAQINVMLRDALQASPENTGDISLRGGHAGRWMTGSAQGFLELAVVWSCEVSPAGFTRYVAYSRQPDPGREKWGDRLVELASKFTCIESLSPQSTK